MPARLVTVALLLLIAPAASPADEPKKISGRVADQAGRAVPGASVAASWGANGLSWDQVVALGNKEPQKLWQNEGKMEPWGECRVVTDADGRFSIPAPARMKRLMIYDRERSHGAVVLFDAKSLEVPIEVRLAPLVRISGTNRLSGSEVPLKWTCTYLNLPYDENDPLEHCRMAICGSFQARFEFLVPPGVYELRASSDDPPSATLENRKVSITADRNEVDLGGLVLRPRDGSGVQNLIDRAKARGTWGDYKQNFGKQPPPWHLTDAKGVAKDAKLSDFQGKWVLLYFWGPDCAPCLGEDLPELMAFYEAHKAQRDRFEILAFCGDFSETETLPDIAALERKLRHVKKAVWGGKDLPFPVLLDNTFQTYERFGLGNDVSSTLLIDPEGKLVEGDLKALEKKLDHLDKNSR